MRNRPPAPGAVPKGEYEHKSHPDFRHGQVSYDRPLTEKEQYDYELTPIRDDSDIPDVAKKIAGGMGEYVSEYLKPENEELLNGKLNEEESRKIIGHADMDKVKAELHRQFGEKPADKRVESAKIAATTEAEIPKQKEQSLSELRAEYKTKESDIDKNLEDKKRALVSEKSRLSRRASRKSAARIDEIDEEWKRLQDEVSDQREELRKEYTPRVQSHPEYKQQQQKDAEAFKTRRAEEDKRFADNAVQKEKDDWARVESEGGYDAVRSGIEKEIRSIESRKSRTKEANQWRLPNIEAKRKDLEYLEQLKSRIESAKSRVEAK